jgi:modulator of FtsH protease HflK
MPWNEPGGNDRDPWSGKNRDNQGPPDLDEVFRKLSDKIGGIFGGKGGGSRHSGKGVGGGGITLIVAVLVVIWLASGIYIVGAGEKGVVFRFGAFSQITDPGPHWHLPYPIESREIVNFTQVRDTQHRSMLLTKDENIIDVELAAQYRVKEAENYLINVRMPDATLREVVDSAVSEIVGQNTMDFILGDGRSAVVTMTKDLVQKRLDGYKTGLEVLSINLQQAQPPEAVQGAFADAIKSREDEARYRNEAEAYSNSVLPQARGEAARIEQESVAYKERVIAEAQGDASRFTQLLKEYTKAPEVTRKRLYLETMETVLVDSSKVLVDVKNSNNLMYLPLDQLMKNAAAGKMVDSRAQESIEATTKSSKSTPSRLSGRTTLRESR